MEEDFTYQSMRYLKQALLCLALPCPFTIVTSDVLTVMRLLDISIQLVMKYCEVRCWVGHKMPWMYRRLVLYCDQDGAASSCLIELLPETDCPGTSRTGTGKQPMKVLNAQSFWEAPRHAQSPGMLCLSQHDGPSYGEIALSDSNAPPRCPRWSRSGLLMTLTEGASVIVEVASDQVLT